MPLLCFVLRLLMFLTIVYSLGPILSGVFASIFAYGIMVVQCHYYFQRYKK